MGGFLGSIYRYSLVPRPLYREEESGRVPIGELSKWNVIIYLKRHVECNNLFEKDMCCMTSQQHFYLNHHVLHDVTSNQRI